MGYCFPTIADTSRAFIRCVMGVGFIMGVPHTSGIMADYPDLQTTDGGREFEKFIDQVLAGKKKDYPSYYGGMKVASGTDFVVTSPIDESINYGRFQEPEEGIMAKAVAAAKDAFTGWSVVPVAERAAYFERFLTYLKARRMYYAAMVTISSGMVR